MNRAGGGIYDDRLFERARQSMALSTFLEGLLGETPSKAGGHYRFDSCPHCGEGHSQRLVVFLPDDRFYFCHKCGAKGSIIDVAMIARNLSSPIEAAKSLLGENPMNSNPTPRRDPRPARMPITPAPATSAPAISAQESLGHDGISTVLSTLLRLSNNKNRPVPKPVFAYLNGRGISSVTIHEAWHRRFFLALDGDPRQIAGRVIKACGKEALADAGFINEKGGLKIIPYRPLIFPLSHHQSAEFRIIREPREDEKKAITKGSKEHDMWYWKGDDGNTEAMVLEGAIDLLSAVDLGNRMTMFGLPGANSFGDGERLVTALKTIGCTKVWLGLDGDEAGRKATTALVEILHKAGFYCVTITHEEGCKDINDVLRHRRAHAEKRAAMPTTAPAEVQAIPSMAPAPAVMEKPKRKPSSTPRKPRAKKKPLTFWGRIRLAAQVLVGRQ